MSFEKVQKGKFSPRYPEKYMGNLEMIVYRSSWELILMNRFDLSRGVKKWSSEPGWIPYINPMKDDRNKASRYFPDFYMQNVEGNKFIIEVKPFKQTQPPRQPQRKTKSFFEECATFSINQAKWNAAERFCIERGFEFVILTENEINVNIGL